MSTKLVAAGAAAFAVTAAAIAATSLEAETRSPAMTAAAPHYLVRPEGRIAYADAGKGPRGIRGGRWPDGPKGSSGSGTDPGVEGRASAAGVVVIAGRSR